MDILAIIISTTIAFGVPLLLVALGGMFSERSGVVNIALEGIMIFSALFGALFMRFTLDTGFVASHPSMAAFYASRPELQTWFLTHVQWTVFIGMIIAAVLGLLFSSLLAFASINLKADQVIGGTALNIFAPAFAVVVAWAIQGQGLTDIPIPTVITLSPESFGIDSSTIPLWVDTLLSKKLYITTPISILILIASFVVLYKTKFGLRLRSCGEHPQAADSVGINVYKMRYAGVLISGAFAGIGGFAYVMASSDSTFIADVAGYGFLALAVMIFGNWKPFRILGAALFFSFFKTMSALAVDPSITFLPRFDIARQEYLYMMLPYLLTMIVLAFTSKKSRAPKAEGIPYDAGKR